MLIEDISTSQIFTAIIFIAALVGVQIYIIKNKNTLKGKWGPNKRIQLIETSRLGPSDRLQIIKVDRCEFLYFFTKGNQPVVVKLNIEEIPSKSKASNLSSPRTLTNQGSGKSSKTSTQENSKKVPYNDSKIIKAISLARKQNPKVSFE